MAADTLNRLFRFTNPRKVVRRAPPASRIWAKLLSKCIPLRRSSSLPDLLPALRLALRTTCASSVPKFSSFRFLTGSEITVRIPSACNCFISATAGVGGGALNGQAISSRVLRLIDIHLSLQDMLAQILLVGFMTQPDLRLQNRAGIQIHSVLRFVDHVGGPSLGLPNLGVQIMGIDPLLVAHLFGPFSVKLPNRVGVLGINPVLAGQASDILPIGLLSVAVDEALERGIGLDDRSINADVLAFEQTVLVQGTEDNQKDFVINLFPQPLADDRQGGMVRGRLGQIVAEESANGDGITTTFGNTPFTGDVFEETDLEHFEIDDRVNAWTASSVHRISGSTQRTGLGRKVEGGESLV